MAISWARVWLGIAVICSILGAGESGGFIEVRAITYHNRHGRRSTGRHCDGSVFGGRTSRCDLKFKLTLLVEGTRIGRSPVYSGVYQDTDTVHFGSRFKSKARNPIVMPFKRWPGKFQIRVEVVDNDWASSNDHVDSLRSEIRVQPDGRIRAHKIKGRFHGANSYFSFTVKVACHSSFFPDTCTKRCSPRNDSWGHYTCDARGNRQCLPGWLILANNCLRRDLCFGVHCQNGGRCVGGSCRCPASHSGARCEHDRITCERDRPCKHGRCRMTPSGNYTCKCWAWWKGRHCDKIVFRCQESSTLPCKNGGICEEAPGSFFCRCPPGFRGPRCEEDVNECNQTWRRPCLHGGRCVNSPGSFFCRCPPGFRGRRCEANVNECNATSTPACLNGGTCTDSIGSFLCVCPRGFRGPRCEADVDECRRGVCLHNGTCTNTLGGFRCTCRPGFAGRLCESTVDLCAASPCQNGGNCTRGSGGGYVCSCADGFAGANCTENVEKNEPAALLAPPGMARAGGGLPVAAIVVCAAVLALIVVALVLILQRRRLRPYVESIRRRSGTSLTSTTVIMSSGPGGPEVKYGNPTYNFEAAEESGADSECGDFGNRLYTVDCGRTAVRGALTGPGVYDSLPCGERMQALGDSVYDLGEEDAEDEEQEDGDDGTYSVLPVHPHTGCGVQTEETESTPPALPPRDFETAPPAQEAAAGAE